MSQLEYAAREIWRRTGRVPDSFEDVVRAVPAAESFKVDPWGNPFQIAAFDTVFVVRSLGADSLADSWDDVVQVSTLDTFWFVPQQDVPIEWSDRLSR
jgi:hypothetical protein